MARQVVAFDIGTSQVKLARVVGGKLKKLLTPALKGVMIVSASVAVLSCVGWLVSRKD